MNCTFTNYFLLLTLLFGVPLSGYAQEYRTFDGRNNNPINPSWGAAHAPLQNITQISFSDSISAPTGTNRPNPRFISNRLFAQSGLLNDPMQLSDYTWVFGQFIDHDVTFVLDGNEPAMIDVPMGDQWFDPMATGQVKIPMLRSAVMEGTGTSPDNPRLFPNEITSFLDASAVYGSGKERADWLRTFSNGKLKISAGNLLPYNTIDGEFDSEIDPDAPHMDDAVGHSPKHFVAGDARANENPLLVGFHTLFVREHNRLCDELIVRYPDWSDEELYQYARKIVGGMLQAIVYKEWLPAMGVHLPAYEGYQSDVNPSISNVFSAAAFRMGHTLLNGNIMMLDNDGNSLPEGNLSLREAFFNIQPVREHGLDPFFKGMGVQVQQSFDSKVIDDVRNFLFGPPGAGGLDLAAININRGRERGLADFNTIRENIGLPRYLFFQQINSNPAIFTALQDLYGNINNIDPWVGMLAEQRMNNALFGPTVMRIMEIQFTNMRDGDRFYYENDPSILPEDRLFVRNTRMVDIVMRNTNITLMQANVFNAMPHSEICPLVTVEGAVFTENGTPLDAVSLFLDNETDSAREIWTDENGAYEFYSIDGCGDYAVYPQKDSNAKNGVSTLDLVLLRKHILNIDPLNSPYKLIAADADRSGTISTFDLVSIRKVILDLENHFPNNSSWRFVPANYQFLDPSDPFSTPFPEYISTDTLVGSFNQNFIAIKVGDLNNSADPDQFFATEGRSLATTEVQAVDQTLPFGETQTLQLTLPKAIQGLQFTLQYDTDLVDITSLSSNLPDWSTSNFHEQKDQGRINISWNHTAGVALDAQQFYQLELQVRAKTTTRLSEALQLNANYLRPEAYTAENTVQTLALAFTPIASEKATATLYQNAPNPFREETIIRFELSQAENARLTVLDATGRVLYATQGEFVQGMNEVRLTKAQLRAASGILYYRLETGTGTFTKSMVLTE